MISVCLASYNGEKYIKEQISSILVQLSDNDELIISDDGSTDNTIAIVYAFNDRRIRIYDNHQVCNKHKYSQSHYNVTSNFENALQYVSGDYVFLADQDDIWNMNKVSTMLGLLQKHQLVMSNYSIINGEGIMIEDTHYVINPISHSFVRNLLRMPFHGCCMAFRKELLDEVMPFPKDLIMHDNWIGLFASLRKYKIGYIETPLIKYRRHQNNVSPSLKQNTNPLWFKIQYRIVMLSQLFKRLLLNI